MSTVAAEIAVPAAKHGRRETRKLLRSVSYHGAVIAFGVVMIYPLLWLFASSLKGPAEIWTNVSSLIPQEPTLTELRRRLGRFRRRHVCHLLQELLYLRGHRYAAVCVSLCPGRLWLCRVYNSGVEGSGSPVC